MNEDMTQPNDHAAGIAVLVMGITGVGKSTFISKLIGDDAGIGHKLTSYTSGVEFHSMKVKDRLVYLVDTPGFNDTYRSDFEILSEITFILAQTYRHGMKIAGILYLHRTSDNRVSGSTLRNFKLLKSMCGLDAAPRVFLVTTMWGSATEEHQEELLRKSSLVCTTDFWGCFSQHGSQTKRWRGDGWSALSIVDALLSLGEEKGYKPLLIQRELVDDKKPLKETTAGLELISDYTKAEERLTQEISSLQSDTSGDQYDAKSGLSELRNEIREMRLAQRKLRISTQKLFTEREHAYSELLSKMRDEQKKLSVELREQNRRYKRLQNELKSNDELLASERYCWSQKRAKLEQEARIGRRRRDSIELECLNIQEEESLVNEHFSDFQHENQSTVSNMSQNMLELRKRDVAKRNILPLLGIFSWSGSHCRWRCDGACPPGRSRRWIDC